MLGGMFGSAVTMREIGSLVDSFRHGANNTLKLKSQNSTGSFFINTFCRSESWSCGEMSYPNYGGPCKRFQFPDVRVLAELLESLGVDFRILVVVRNAVDVLLSTTVHRHFGYWKYNAEMYADIVNERILNDQLYRLDKRFFRCIDYDKLPYVSVNMQMYNMFLKYNLLYLGGHRTVLKYRRHDI